MANAITLDPARDVAADIGFARADFSQTAPLLRYCASLTWETETTRDEFVAAAVSCGYNAATAGVCWAYGRKQMKEMEA
jgi:hypothetical protein